MRPENFKNGRVPLCNEDIFRSKMYPMQRYVPPKSFSHTVKASYITQCSCDRLMINQLDSTGENYKKF